VSDLKHRFRNVLLCEDVRDELRRKHSLIGVYSGDIVVAELPAFVQLAAYILYEPDKGFKGDIRFKVQVFLDDTKIIEGELSGTIADAETHAVFVLPKGMLQIPQPSIYRIIIVMDDQEVEILSKKILIGEVNLPSGP